MNSNNKGLLDDLPGFESLSVEDQMRLVTDDPSFQQSTLNGETLGVMYFNEITKRYADRQKAEKDKALADAQVAQEKLMEELERLKTDSALRTSSLLDED